MRIFRSYYVTITFVTILSLLFLFNSLIEKFTETINGNIARLSVYERDFDYSRLKSQLDKLNVKVAEYNVTPQTREAALENFLAFADTLNKEFKIAATTDRPLDSGDILSLDIVFKADFKNETEFMNFVRHLAYRTHPLINIDRLILQEIKNRNHAADFQIKFIEPYVRGAK